MTDIELDSPKELLAHVETLRRGTRARVRGAWLPLLVFAAVTLASIPLYWRAFEYPHAGGGFFFDHRTPYVAGLPGADSQAGASVFWLIAAPLCYLFCAAWYHRRAQRRGLEPRWPRYIALGLALFAFVALVNLIPDRVLLGRTGVATGHRGTLGLGTRVLLTPLVGIAVGLLVLAWIERSKLVVAVALAYGGLVVIINTYGLGQQPAWFTRYPVTREYFVAPAHDLILLASILGLGAAISGAQAWRARAAS